MDEAGSARKPDYVNGRLVSCAGSRKMTEAAAKGVMNAGTRPPSISHWPGTPYVADSPI